MGAISGPGGSGGSTDVQLFSATGAQVWTKPTNAKFVEVWLIGAGGGGGGGCKDTNASTKTGGSGGGGGGLSYGFFDADDLGVTETVTVGAGGASVAGVTADIANGNNGNAGADTTFGTFLSAAGGAGGLGGLTAGTTRAGGAGGAGTVSDGRRWRAIRERCQCKRRIGGGLCRGGRRRRRGNQRHADAQKWRGGRRESDDVSRRTRRWQRRRFARWQWRGGKFPGDFQYSRHRGRRWRERGDRDGGRDWRGRWTRRGRGRRGRDRIGRRNSSEWRERRGREWRGTHYFLFLMAGHISQPGASGGGGSTDVQRFTAAGAQVWTKPVGAKLVRAFLLAGGGGGGSGSLRNINLATEGGGGGGGGGASVGLFRADDLAATENLTVGAGGAGGAGAANAQRTPGIAGSPGTASQFGDTLFAGPGLGGEEGGTGNGSSIDGGDGGVGNYSAGAKGSQGAGTGTVAGQNEAAPTDSNAIAFHVSEWGRCGGRECRHEYQRIKRRRLDLFRCEWRTNQNCGTIGRRRCRSGRNFRCERGSGTNSHSDHASRFRRGRGIAGT